jgi:hypothetical protein
MTQREGQYVSQVLASGLDSAARFTVKFHMQFTIHWFICLLKSLCASHLKEVLGPSCVRAVVLPSGTAALEMAALLIDLRPGA